ncbi:MAG: hypothetical protein GX791_01945 [Synergistaceae bacterium]|nr:hypothetical protein [Synergistaceae bacterium]
MALKMCAHCGKAYLDGGEQEKISLCAECSDFLNALYRKAWTWLRDRTAEEGRHPRITSAQLAEILSVDVRSIELLVKLDRIQTDQPSEEESHSRKDRETMKIMGRRIARKGWQGHGRR